MHLASFDREVPEISSSIAPAPASAPWTHTILLVEDEVFVLHVAGEILRSAGYGVLTARTAAEADRVFRNQLWKVQLLLTDVVLPDRNGCDLALELAAVSPAVKVVFISGYPENAVTSKGLPRPGWHYLPKPFSAVSLLKKIKDALHGI